MRKKGTELLDRERDRESRASEPRSLVALRALLWMSLSEWKRERERRRWIDIGDSMASIFNFFCSGFEEEQWWRGDRLLGNYFLLFWWAAYNDRNLKRKVKKEAIKMMGPLNFTFTVIIRVIFVKLKLDPYNQVRFHGSEFRQTRRYFQSHIRL